MENWITLGYRLPKKLKKKHWVWYPQYEKNYPGQSIWNGRSIPTWRSCQCLTAAANIIQEKLRRLNRSFSNYQKPNIPMLKGKILQLFVTWNSLIRFNFSSYQEFELQKSDMVKDIQMSVQECEKIAVIIIWLIL